MDLMMNKLFFNVLRNRIQEIIENRECNIYLLSDAKKNIDLMNAFYKSGIREHYDVLEATWKVASDICPDEIKDDNQRDTFTIVVWKSLPLESILRELDITDDEFSAPEDYEYKDKVYFKLSYSFEERLICLSLHLAEYGS
ncbi:hypothetical protein DS66_00115 [Mesotoga sp. SC_3PWM13N19]|nr:hypothetical protein DS66_00115 [Mesotoga sp. SC_3PWM13N19]